MSLLAVADDESYHDDTINDGKGSYTDLGTIISPLSAAAADGVDVASPLILDNNLPEKLSLRPSQPDLSATTTATTTTLQEWRSNHWIILIDDEPSIRLAIGDYLHSVGYTMITACDGPRSFLNVLLYSCGWSFMMSTNEEEAVVTKTSFNDVNVNVGVDGKRPPWMKENMLWRLPDCIISDVRMPGGVDGVELLELLRQQQRQRSKNNNKSSSEQQDADQDNNDARKSKQRKNKKKRGGSSKINDNNAYDGKDEFELLDAIILGNGGGISGAITDKDNNNDSNKRKIVTATDQARQVMDIITDILTYLQEERSNNISSNNNNNYYYYSSTPKEFQSQVKLQQQYPNSLHQIPVILLTAKAMVSDRIVAYKAGANNYLPKPFRPEELLGMVDRLMRKQEGEMKELMTAVQQQKTSDSNDGKDFSEGLNSNNEVVTYVDKLKSYAALDQQVKDLIAELIEIKNLLKEEEFQKSKAKVEQDKIKNLTKLLPEALWMYLNGERRKRLFTSDHIRSILRFCFDNNDDGVETTAKCYSSLSLARKSIVKRDDLLAELERMNEEYPDRLQDFLADQ